MSETLEVEQLIEHLDGDETICGDCGDEIELWTEVCYEPVGPSSKMVLTVHAACAVRNGFRLGYPADE